MVSKERLERLRKFFPYSVWSDRAIDFWNAGIRVKAVVHKGVEEEQKKVILETIEAIRISLNQMCDAIKRTDWINQPVDSRVVGKALLDRYTPNRFFVAEGITFETLCANLNMVLADAIDELVVAKWIDFTYTLTFRYPGSNEMPPRTVEFELKSGVADTEEDREKAEELVQAYDEVDESINENTVTYEIIRKAEYGFMLDPTNLVSRFDYEEQVERPEAESINAKLIDQDASFTVADATGSFTPPEWWKLGLKNIIAGLYIRTFSRKKGRPTGVQKKL